jgi:hypothetical protein
MDCRQRQRVLEIGGDLLVPQRFLIGELAPETVPPQPSDEWCLLVGYNCSAELAAAAADSREGTEGSSGKEWAMAVGVIMVVVEVRGARWKKNIFERFTTGQRKEGPDPRAAKKGQGPFCLQKFQDSHLYFLGTTCFYARHC